MATSRRHPEKNPKLGIAIALLFFAPQLAIPVLIIWGILQLVKNKPAQPRQTSSRNSFDDCPQQLFCFHKDKGEHHIRKGKEIDPWDRPDIDISQYQRRN